MVIFQEHFFQGAISNGQGDVNVIDESNRRQIGEWISEISPNMLWLCNCTTLSHAAKEDDVDESNKASNVLELETNATPLWITNMTKVFNTNLKNNYTSGETFTHSRSASSANIAPKRADVIEYVLQNRTDFWWRGNVVATYRKSTYCNEAPELIIEPKVLYIYGDRKIHTPRECTTPDLSKCVISNFFLEICRDYTASRDKTNSAIVKFAVQLSGINFHIVQSDSILPRQVEQSIEVDNITWITPSSSISQKYFTLQKFPKYFIVADSGKRLVSNLSKNFVKCEKKKDFSPPECNHQLFFTHPYFDYKILSKCSQIQLFLISKSRTLFAQTSAKLPLFAWMPTEQRDKKIVSSSLSIPYEFTMIEPQSFISVHWNNVIYRISIHRIG